MLIEFSVGNFRSFKDLVTFSMVAANLSSRNQLDETNVFKVDNDLSLLKSAAIYGANASGKSNLIAAIRFMRRFIISSSRDTQVTDRIRVENFKLSEDCETKPSSFEMVFFAAGKRYRYGFEVTSERVTSEWLHHVPKVREAPVFERELDEIYISSALKEARGLEKRTRSNALFLSVGAQFDVEIPKLVLGWFHSLSVSLGLDDRYDHSRALSRFENTEYQRDIVQFVKKLDLGVDDIQTEKSSLNVSDFPESLNPVFENMRQRRSFERTLVKTRHKKYDSAGYPVAEMTFDLDEHESQGTRKLFALAHPILHSLRTGRILVVDELDARLHPIITQEIIKLFNSNETNPKNAQLVFTTHDTNLLNNTLFRRDQIWFTEKSRYGATQLYSLAEYKTQDNNKVRNDASYEKNYIEGRYGAVPFIGDFTSLIDADDEQKEITE